ncbi:MAG TPA: VOC family protein [Pseudonocardia sp.]|jgi:uncharacterized protein|nr:VOC family protein [Pseudonocardia sp.]
MPARDTVPAGAPCWIELTTSDTARSREFYCRLLGWEADEPAEEFGGYFTFTSGAVPVAGGMPAMSEAPVTDVWSVYLASDDARKTVEAAVAAGGQVIAPAMDVAGLGTMAVLAGPDGAVVGVWQPGTHRGFGVHAEPGAPSWFELHTRDHPGAVAFYRDAFGWDTQAVADTPEFRYTTLRHGEEWLAGIMDAAGHLPDGVPSRWAVYFGVADTDTAVADAVEMGAQVVHPAEDTEYGRIAVLTDPTGAQFRLVAANEAMPAKE